MTPNIFIRIGDTDCWDFSTAPQAGASFLLGGDLRTLHGSGYTTVNAVCSILSRLTVEPTSYKRRAEWLVIDSPGSGAQQFGIFDAAAAFDNATSAASQVGATTHSRGGGINRDGINLTIVDAWTIGDVIGLDLWRDGDSDYVQFLKNGDPEYDPIEITFGRRWHLVGCLQYVTSHAAMLLVDRDDLRFPGNSMPWGAAARVSDIGGYSPEATRLAAADASITVLPDGRTCIGSSDTRLCLFGEARKPKDGLVYVEAVPEVSAANGGMLGLVPADSVTNTWPGSGTSNGYGIFRRPGGSFDGEVYFDGSTVADLGSFAASDVPGYVWDQANGKLWWTKNGVPFSGDPEAGTGAHHTGVSTDLIPAVAPYNGGRWRIALHRSDQQHRPSYATAWEGPDILPAQHHRARIASDTEITQELWFQPWGGSRKSGSPIGAIELHNQDGRYDALSGWDLRDQQVAIYERIEDGSIEPLARALVDNVKRDGRRKMRIMSRGMDALLDVRIDTPMLLFGSVLNASAVLADDNDPIYRVGHRPWMAFKVFDPGVEVADAQYWNSGGAYGFERNVNQAGKNTAWGVDCYEDVSAVTPMSLYNNTFVLWTGDTPTNWLETSAGTGTANVTPGAGGYGARFIRGVGEGAVELKTSASVASNFRWVRVTVSAYTGGDLTLREEYGTTYDSAMRFGINGVGEFWATRSGLYDIPFQLEATEGSDFTIHSVELFDAKTLDSFKSVIEELLAGVDYVEYSGSELIVGSQTDQRPTRRALLDQYCATCLLDYYTDNDSRLRFVPWPITGALHNRFGSHAPTAVFSTRLRCGELGIEDDLAPALSDAHAVGKNYNQHSEGDLADGANAFYRRYLTAPYYRENRINFGSTELSADYASTPYYAKPLHGFYAHAVGAAPTAGVASSLNAASSTPGSGKDNRLWALHRTYCFRRRFFTDKQPVVSHRDVQLGDMVTLSDSSIAGLPTDPVMVVKKTRRLLSPTIDFKLWG